LVEGNTVMKKQKTEAVAAAELMATVSAAVSELRGHNDLNDAEVARRLNKDGACHLFDDGWTARRVWLFTRLFGVGYRRPGPRGTGSAREEANALRQHEQVNSLIGIHGRKGCRNAR
jgi:hypothetical protein